jgi:predicted outer membrane repeat protein
VPAGYVADATDCDDGAASTFPGGTEVCGGGDEDCDGTVDEADATDARTWYADADGDTYGSPAAPVRGCVAASGQVADATDCDDTRADVHPGAPELCDDVDDDCEGTVDEGATDAPSWYADTDGDGYGDAAVALVQCDAPTDHVGLATDCDDTDAAVSPAATEVCNYADDDCDGAVDEGTGYTWYIDADGDGQGSSRTGIACDASPPAGYAAAAGDCDDSDVRVYTGAPELCDSQFDDCADLHWVASDESGLVTYESADGEWTDATAEWAAGTSATTAAITTPADGVVHVCPATWYVRLTVPAGADLTLVSEHGAATTILDAEYDGAVITMEDDAVVLDVDDLTLKRGYAANGGGIHDPGGVLTVTDTLFQSMYPVTATGGGGIWSSGGTVSIIDSDVTGYGGSASNIRGGGIYAVDTDLSITGSTITGTSTWGGGVYWAATGDASLDITDTTFDSCTADQHGAGLYVDADGTGNVAITNSTFDSNGADYNGGGVYLTGDGTAAVDITDTLFDNNGGDRYGGGLYADSAATLTLSDLTLTGNDGGWGGCMYLQQDATVTSSSFTDNGTPYATNATGYGSAAYIGTGVDVTFTDVDMDGNQTFYKGGAVYVSTGSFTCERCTITDNTLVSTTTCYNGSLTAFYCAGAGLYSSGGTVTLVDSEVSGNTFSTSRNTYGGGIAMRDSALVLQNTDVATNAAVYGGGLFLYGVATPATASIESGSVVDGNTATYGGGAYLYGGDLTCTDDDGSNTAMTTNTGGAVYYSSTGTNAVTVTGCDFGASASADDNPSASGSPTCDVFTPTAGWYDFDDDVSFTCDATTCI